MNEHATTPEVITIGETMVMLVPADAKPIRADSTIVLRVGGAESNVAASLSGLGHKVQWVSALGDDPFGEIIRADLRQRGIDVSEVHIDSSAPTGLYAKNPNGENTEVYYYRAGSAASRMSPDTLASSRSAGAALVHLSGTTPALSASCQGLATAVVEHRVLGESVVSFDVNYRPKLWTRQDAAPALRRLANASDITFVGRDEAESLWGTRTADQIRDYLPEPRHLVVKDADVGATAFGPNGKSFVPARPVDVVETVGAGDAFAAGWLSGYLRALPEEHCLALGHVIASRALAVVGDCPSIPSAAELEDHLRRYGVHDAV